MLASGTSAKSMVRSRTQTNWLMVSPAAGKGRASIGGSLSTGYPGHNGKVLAFRPPIDLLGSATMMARVPIACMIGPAARPMTG